MALKEVVGQVTSNKMNKTITVAVRSKVAHKKYSKIISKTKKYYAHDEHNSCQIGDIVQIQQARPISRKKCWTLIKLID